ncbi:hypothetical protein Z043_126311, partial [Scleropages formosus]
MAREQHLFDVKVLCGRGIIVFAFSCNVFSRTPSPAHLTLTRKAVAKTVLTDCRCHGVSGSCAVKTCWRTLAPFDRVGRFLKERYENGVHVLHRSRRKVRRKDKDRRRLPVGKEELIFLNKSPNYCLEDRR